MDGFCQAESPAAAATQVVADSAAGSPTPGGALSRSDLPPGVRLDGTVSRTLRLTLWLLRWASDFYSSRRLDLVGLEDVPADGPLLICSNHVSNFDPLVLAAVLPRVPHAMTKAELFGHPLMRAFLVRANCFPVHRGKPDRMAVRGALAVLRSGGALIIFPEGHRAVEGGLQPFQPGAGYLALRARATVLPCAIWGTEKVLPPSHLIPRRGLIHVRFGTPFQPSGRDSARVSREIESRVSELLPGRYRSSADPVELDGEDQGGVGGDGGAGGAAAVGQ